MLIPPPNTFLFFLTKSNPITTLSNILPIIGCNLLEITSFGGSHFSVNESPNLKVRPNKIWDFQ